MNTITIPQKQSNSGNIYDLASDKFERTINMNGFEYCVVAPAYYNLKPTRHKIDQTAIKAYKALVKQGYQGVQILDNKKNKKEVISDYWSSTLA